MDQRTPINKSLIQHEYILPEDVSMIAICDLDEATRLRLVAFDKDIALSRRHVRATTQVIDQELSHLLNQFRHPCSIVQAIARHCKNDPQQAESVLEEVLPIFADMIQRSILVEKSQHDEEQSNGNLMPGENFNGYQILRCLQSFADGSVFMATDEGGSYCSLKVSSKNCLSSIRHRFNNEIRILKHLNLDGVVQLLAHGESDDRLWMTTRWIEGVSAARRAAELRELRDWHGLKELAQCIAASYSALHRQGIAHGDVHPDNVIVGGDGAITLLDFGLSRRLDESGRFERGGIAFYSDPEYARCQLERIAPPPVNAANEQFSVAALLYQLVTGQHYTDFDLEHEAMYTAIANPRPEHLRLPGKLRWPAIEVIIHKALSKHEIDRHTDCTELASALMSCELPDEPRATTAHTQTFELRTFVDERIETVQVNATEAFSKFTHGPTCSLNGGAAGIAHALHRLACQRESADLLHSSEQWIQVARLHQSDTNAFHDEEFNKEFEAVGACSVHHGSAGIAFTQALISVSVSDVVTADRAIAEFKSAITQPTTAWDATLGRLSCVLACIELESTLREIPTNCSVLRQTACDLLDSVWQESLEHEDVVSSAHWGNLGFAHGWGGLLYTTLLMHVKGFSSMPTQFMDRVNQFRNTLVPVARGHAFEWLNESGHPGGMMAGWCNGSAGAVPLFALLHEYESNGDWLEVAQSLAWHCWETDGGPVDLCCGSAGRILALLRVYQLTEDSDWLKRATYLARRAIARAPALDHREREPYSLFKGQLGLALAVEGVLDPDKACMPMMGIST